MKNDTLIILGSSRGDGNTRMIADFLVKNKSADMMNLGAYNFGYYDYEYKNAGDDFLGLAERMLKYDKIIFCTPVYWYSMSAVMKTYFDRFSDLVTVRKEKGRGLAGKTMIAICCSSSAEEYEGFFMPFQKTAEYLDMKYGGDLHTWVEDGRIPKGVEKKLLTI